jgi:RNA polymerase sigma-70 factor (ECF subfamily)
MAGGEVTRWLARWRAGDPDAFERMVPLVYEELRQVARRQLRREAQDHTLSATALVHEVYLRLLRQERLTAIDRDSFLAIAAQTMRRILVDHARSRLRLKRGGAEKPVSLDPQDDVPLLNDNEIEEVLAVDRALERLGALDERALRVIECRIFAGLTLEETAQALGVSSRSVQRTWNAARAWLRKEIGGSVPDPSFT